MANRKIIKTVFIRLLVTIFFVQSGLAVATGEDPGTITIYADNAAACSLKVEEGTVDIQKGDKGCKDDSYMKRPSIEFKNVRSATTITLSTPISLVIPFTGCENSDNYTVTLRITKEKLSSSLDVWELIKQDIGTVVIPGVRLTHKEFHHPEFMTGIRCVRISFD
jgi:type 1 fimbria pilin